MALGNGHRRLLAMFARLADARPFFVIAGPCVVESTAHCVQIAKEIRAIGERLGILVIFKASCDKANRRRADSFRGPGMGAGLEALRVVRETVGIPVTTDVHEPAQVQAAAQVCDMLQIPSLLCRQTDLISAAARSGRVVNIKKGQFATADIMLDAASKARMAAAEAVGQVAEGAGGGVLLTERGNSFGYDDLVVDPRNLVRLRNAGRGSGAGGESGTNSGRGVGSGVAGVGTVGDSGVVDNL